MLVNEQQYRCLRGNRRMRDTALRLDQARPGGKSNWTPLAGVIARAARRLRQRQAAAHAWEQIASPDWLAQTEVESVAGDMVTILGASSTVCYDLHRRRTALERQLSRLVPGVCRLRFVVAGAQANTEDP